MKIEKKFDISLTDCKLFLSVNGNMIFVDNAGKQYILKNVEEEQQTDQGPQIQEPQVPKF